MRICADKIIRKCKINLHTKKGGVVETYKSMKLTTNFRQRFIGKGLGK
jgi:hypothetical protein